MGERIRIVDMPPGQAPEWVRKQWVGLELPVEEDAPDLEEGVQFGIRGGNPENLGGYPVRTADAIASLQEKSPRAVRWWENNLPLEAVPRLVFKKEVCEVLPEIPENNS